MNQRRERSCIGKVKHRKKSGARKAIAMMAEKGDSLMKVYWCNACRGYHVGHPTGRQKKLGMYYQLISAIDKANKLNPQ